MGGAADGLFDNRRILGALLANDITVKGDDNPALFHQTFILHDDDGRATTTSALLTGSANFCLTDTHRNRNHIVVFHSAYVCRRYLDEIEQVRRGNPAVVDTARCLAPTTWAACRSRCCSPRTTPELELVKQILARAARSRSPSSRSPATGDQRRAARDGRQRPDLLDPRRAGPRPGRQGW